MSEPTYWAAEKDTKLLVSKITGFLNTFSLHAESNRSNLASIWTRNLRMYYQMVIDNDSLDSSLNFAGDDGELIDMHVPVARSDIRKIISIVCRQRLNFKSQAESTDYTTKANTQASDALAFEYATSKDINLNQVREKLLELSLVCGHSFLLNIWDMARGLPVFRIIPPWMATFNYNADSINDLDWFVAHYFVNRYTLAEQYPDFRDEILNAPSDKTSINPWAINFGISKYAEDDVLVSEFYHRSTLALEQGRYVKFINNIAIEDLENPYLDKNGRAEIPVGICIPETIQPYLLGYPKICDLMPLQEMTDHQFSTMASIFSALGTPAILNPRGSGMNASNMNGLKVISYSPLLGDGLRAVEPKILELCKLPPNLLDTIGIMQQFQQRLSNISGALQGQLPPGVTAASAIATLSATAVEFIEPMSLAVHSVLEEGMFRAIMQTSQFMTEEKTLEMIGPNESKTVMTFKADDLKGLKRVSLFTQNPLSLFAGGRSKIAEDYMKMGAVTTPEEYDSVMVHGTVRPVQEKRITKELRTSWENEELRNGRTVIALATDDHAFDIYQHTLLFNDPEIRKNAELIELIDSHIQEHLELSRAVDVGLYAMAQTGKNLPPDQNTPTGAPEVPQNIEMTGEPKGAEEQLDIPGVEVTPEAKPANPAEPIELGAL